MYWVKSESYWNSHLDIMKRRIYSALVYQDIFLTHGMTRSGSYIEKELTYIIGSIYYKSTK